MITLGFYGTLRDLDVLKAVVGLEEFSQLKRQRGWIPGRLEYVCNATYPTLVHSTESVVAIDIVTGLSIVGLQRLDHYEDSQYKPTRRRVTVEQITLGDDIRFLHGLGETQTVKTQRDVFFYGLDGKLSSSNVTWNLQTWQAVHKATFMPFVHDHMKDFGQISAQPCMTTVAACLEFRNKNSRLHKALRP